jgi:hypothetical protein
MLEYVIVKNSSIKNKEEDKKWVHNLLFIKVIHIFVFFFHQWKEVILYVCLECAFWNKKLMLLMNGN